MNSVQQSVLSKASWRLLPFMFALYVISYLDRINISFAAAPMMEQLHFSAAVFGFAGGIFFWGYCIFAVPSNMMVQRIGARRWISAIMVLWGLLSCATSMVTDAATLYVMRFALGAAEAGFFPGMILYLTYWFPARQRGMAVAKFMTAIPVSGMIGGIVSSWLLELHGLWGLAGWKWLFLLTGLPAVTIGALVWFYLCDGPHDAKWLCDHEREALLELLAADAPGDGQTKAGMISALLSGKVWLFAAIYFCVTLTMYGFTLWLPLLLKESLGASGSSSLAAQLTVLPAGFQALGMIFIARRSDASGDRRGNLLIAAAAGTLGCLCAANAGNPVLLLASSCLIAFGVWGIVGPFWALPTAFLPATSAAAGIALINAVGNLGGFAGPTLLGVIHDSTAKFSAGFYTMAAALIVGAALALLATRAPVKKPYNI